MATKTKPEEQQPIEGSAATQQITTTLQQVPAPLPGEHINHDAVFYNEINIRYQGFAAALEAVDAEITGKKLEREDKIAEIERIFNSDMASLERRRTMMVMGIEMAQAAMDRFNAGTPVEKNAQHDDNEGNSD